MQGPRSSLACSRKLRAHPTGLAYGWSTSCLQHGASCATPQGPPAYGAIFRSIWVSAPRVSTQAEVRDVQRAATRSDLAGAALAADPEAGPGDQEEQRGYGRPAR